VTPPLLLMMMSLFWK